MTTWRYIGFDRSTRKMKDGFVYKTPEIESDTSPGADYVSLENILDIYELGPSFYADSLQWRWKIRDIVLSTGWTNLTNEEKDIAIELDIDTNSTEKVVHMMTTQGKTQAEAIQVLQETFASNHILTVDSCKNRAEEAAIYEIIAKYLSQPDAAEFFSLIQSLYLQYTNQAIMGTVDGTVGVGFFDFIESTPGTIYENTGLSAQGFVMQNGDPDESNLITELMLWFRQRQRI